MSGKKGKKTKGITMNLHEWQNDGNPPTKVITSSWADEAEEENDYGTSSYSTRKQEPLVLPTAPRAARDPDYNDESIPKEPPFVAYLSNLPYDLEEPDIIEFFEELAIESIRLPTDSDGKLKGYGYVQFEDRGSLVEAIAQPKREMRGRRIRIECSTSTNDGGRNRGGGMGRENRGRDYGDDPERTTGDWRSGGRDEGGAEPANDRYRPRGAGGSGFDRDRRDDRDGGAENNRTTGAWRDGDRPKPSFRDSRDSRDSRHGNDVERDWSSLKNRGGSRDRDRDGGDRGGSSFGPRRGFGDYDRSDRSDRMADRGDRMADRGDRMGDRGDRMGDRGDRMDRGGDRGDRGGDRGGERWANRNIERDPPSAGSEARTRPKLQLQPRSKPIENPARSEEPETETSSPAQAPAPKPTPVPAANIFGAAKPVDTAAREREIEERLKKDTESRAKEEEPKKPQIWGRRNGESRDGDQEKARPAWRSRNDNNDERGSSFDRNAPRSHSSQNRSDNRDSRDSRNDSRGPPPNSAPAGGRRGDSKQTESPERIEKDKRNQDDDEVIKMPKAKDNETPNFVASNKYSMLPDDVDPDNIEE